MRARERERESLVEYDRELIYIKYITCICLSGIN